MCTKVRAHLIIHMWGNKYDTAKILLLIFCKHILIVNRQEWWLCVVPLPSSTFGGWRVLVRNLSRSWCSWITPIRSHRDGAVKLAKLASSLPAAATDLMSLKTASLPSQSQHIMSDQSTAHFSRVLWQISWLISYKPGPTAVRQGVAHIIFDEEDWNRCSWLKKPALILF